MKDAKARWATLLSEEGKSFEGLGFRVQGLATGGSVTRLLLAQGSRGLRSARV